MSDSDLSKLHAANAANIAPALTKILREHLDVPADRIKPEALLVEDLGADSLDMIEIVMAIEEQFDVAITDDAAEEVKSVADAVRVIGDALNAEAAA